MGTDIELVAAERRDQSQAELERLYAAYLTARQAWLNAIAWEDEVEDELEVMEGEHELLSDPDYEAHRTMVTNNPNYKAEHGARPARRRRTHRSSARSPARATGGAATSRPAGRGRRG